MDEEAKRAILKYLIEQGVPQDWAELIVQQIAQTDISGWTEDQFVSYLTDWVAESQRAMVGIPRLQKQGIDLTTLFPPTTPVAPERQKTTAELQPDILSFFTSQRVPRARATTLANQLSQVDYTGWTQPQIDRYMRDWAGVAKSEQWQDAMAMFLASPDIQEQQRRQEVAQAVQRRFGTTDPEVLRMLSEQQAITATEQIKQRQLSEQERQFQERVQPLRTFGEITAPFVEKSRAISPAFQRFAERELPAIFQELGMSQQRANLLKERMTFEPEPRGAGEIFLTGTSEEIAEAEAPHIEWEERQARRRRKDPWEELLAEPSFLASLEERFRGLAPEERGFFSGRFRPRARFLG